MPPHPVPQLRPARAQRGTPPARHPGKLSAWQALPEHPANILPRHRSIGMSDKDRWLFGRMRQKAAYFFHVYGYRPFDAHETLGAILPAECVRKLSAQMNVELMVGQEVFGRYAGGITS